ncbi:MAG: hypothetical protein ACI4ME_11215 [Aristaeellaceae bacterium]
MKEMYEKPMAEKIVFSYKEQVVAASGGCTSQWTNIGDSTCNYLEQVRNFSGSH